MPNGEEMSSGSSPHTRGARACVGSSGNPSWDHPRIRGEHRRGAADNDRRGGIIPAYAGSTATHVLPRYGVWGSSPHTRGALGTCAYIRYSLSGSSPHTRGALEPCANALEPSGDHPRIRGEHLEATKVMNNTVGIIPAYAGSTRAGFTVSRQTTGSSPHTRGAPPPSVHPSGAP